MSIYIHTLTVRGSGPFPFDMLRRDGCYPRQTPDADALGACALGCDPLELRTVTLVHVSAQAFWMPTRERWESFGWRVVGWESEDPRGRSHVHIKLEEA